MLSSPLARLCPNTFRRNISGLCRGRAVQRSGCAEVGLCRGRAVQRPGCAEAGLPCVFRRLYLHNEVSSVSCGVKHCRSVQGTSGLSWSASAYPRHSCKDKKATISHSRPFASRPSLSGLRDETRLQACIFLMNPQRTLTGEALSDFTYQTYEWYACQWKPFYWVRFKTCQVRRGT
jgi:hypothetical protein